MTNIAIHITNSLQVRLVYLQSSGNYKWVMCKLGVKTLENIFILIWA